MCALNVHCTLYNFLSLLVSKLKANIFLNITAKELKISQ